MRHWSCRIASLAIGGTLTLLMGCQRPPAAAASGVGDRIRRSGLWQQTLVRDGKSFALGRLRVCVDETTDARMTMIGHAMGHNSCTHTVSREAAGAWRFQSTCHLGRGGVVASTGTVTSDFASSYRLHADSVITGSIFAPLNGVHVTDVSAKYVGACPADMAPGEVIIGPGLKVNLNRLPIAGAAAAFG